MDGALFGLICHTRVWYETAAMPPIHVSSERLLVPPRAEDVPSEKFTANEVSQ